jgi:site-specific DNA-methyltransferase (adenine-specific)
MISGRFEQGDCLELLRAMPDNSVDLVCCSPPYEAARTYGIDFNYRGESWVEWAVERYLECVRVSRGVVMWNVEGQTRKFQWSATPALMMADLHRAGVKLRKPPIFHRVGIPGSGGPDWLRNDYEFCVCSSKGKLQWSDNTAMGHPPKWAPGGEMSHRNSAGARRNQWGGGHAVGGTGKDGVRRNQGHRPSHVFDAKVAAGAKIHTKAEPDGTMREQAYLPPVLANPGNVIKCRVGGGVMGSRLAHLNEAPYPERLPEWFIRSFCPPDGTVLDPFSGSGTTVCVAVRCGRNGIGFDVRQSQVDLGYKRLAEVQREMF